jgi:predicted amidohydrolase
MRVGYVQSSPVFGEKNRNFEQIASMLDGIKADLIVLPELFATGYAFRSRGEAVELAEDPEGETRRFLGTMAKNTGGVVAGGFVERDGQNLFNSALLVSADEVVGVYRKLHLFNKETLWFQPGNRPIETYDVGGINIGLMICFDWIFPETARTLALKGADILAHPANLVLPYCQSAMRTRCLENRLFAVTANRIGRERRAEDDFTFTGASQITSYKGEILRSGPQDRVLVETADIDVERARDKKITPYNDLLSDRRVEFYWNRGKEEV